MGYVVRQQGRLFPLAEFFELLEKLVKIVFNLLHLNHLIILHVADIVKRLPHWQRFTEVVQILTRRSRVRQL